MNCLKNPLLLIVLVAALLTLPGCLGQRYESNVPVADLDLWDENDDQQGNAGRPRYLGNRGTLPSSRETLPRGTLPNRGMLPGRGTLPDRGTLPLRRGTLPRR